MNRSKTAMPPCFPWGRFSNLPVKNLQLALRRPKVHTHGQVGKPTPRAAGCFASYTSAWNPRRSKIAFRYCLPNILILPRRVKCQRVKRPLLLRRGRYRGVVFVVKNHLSSSECALAAPPAIGGGAPVPRQAWLRSAAWSGIRRRAPCWAGPRVRSELRHGPFPCRG